MAAPPASDRHPCSAPPAHALRHPCKLPPARSPHCQLRAVDACPPLPPPHAVSPAAPLGFAPPSAARHAPRTPLLCLQQAARLPGRHHAQPAVQEEAPCICTHVGGHGSAADVAAAAYACHHGQVEGRKQRVQHGRAIAQRLRAAPLRPRAEPCACSWRRWVRGRVTGPPSSPSAPSRHPHAGGSHERSACWSVCRASVLPHSAARTRALLSASFGAVDPVCRRRGQPCTPLSLPPTFPQPAAQPQDMQERRRYCHACRNRRRGVELVGGVKGNEQDDADQGQRDPAAQHGAPPPQLLGRQRRCEAAVA